jgi:hypothetical protein
VNIPLAVATFALGAAVLPRSLERSGRIDLDFPAWLCSRGRS